MEEAPGMILEAAFATALVFAEPMHRCFWCNELDPEMELRAASWVPEGGGARGISLAIDLLIK